MAQPGKDAQLYYDPAWSDGQFLNPISTFNRANRCVDIAISNTTSTADVTTRDEDWTKRKNLFKDAQMTFGLRKSIPETVDYDFFRNAWLNDLDIMVALLESTRATGIKGWLVNCVVSQFTENWPLQDGQLTDVILNPTTSIDGNGALINPALIVVP